MATVPYSLETIKNLTEAFHQTGVYRSIRVDRYDPGVRLTYDAIGVAPANVARVTVEVERFIGGGFAGQVYRVQVIDIQGSSIPGLNVNDYYAMKILVPPSAFSRWFRDTIYCAGFQGPFSLQVIPEAARAGALWQKFIRRAAAMKFGDEKSVVDILATFIDPTIGSCGELSEWVEGRTWLYEVDDHLTRRRKWKVGQPDEGVGSPEYCAKKQFMAEFVDLLHELGAYEFARQYEWWTCKSQPNVLKRLSGGIDPKAGLTAVDFRAGLALLPFLPMSPGDIPLIGKGIARGSLVQFDRGDLEKLQAFVNAHRDHFSDMDGALEELLAAEDRYRHSQIDLTHNHIHLLTSKKIWSQSLDAAVASWRIRNQTDDAATEKLYVSHAKSLLFATVKMLPSLGLLAALIVLMAGIFGPLSFWKGLGCAAVVCAFSRLAGRLTTSLWGRTDYRRHFFSLMGDFDYFGKAVYAHICETLIRWHRAGRVDSEKVQQILKRPGGFFLHWPLSFLPVFLHRMLTDSRYAKHFWRNVALRPIHLYFNSELREEWLREMVAEGKRRHMLTEEDAETILSRIKEPFIQKYLKSLAVHVCTAPITQVVSVSVAIWYVMTHQLTAGEAWAIAGGILLIFQLTPISPGSLARGSYVVYLVIRDRNFKDYNIAVFLGFFKYIGYLAFPIQMAYRYPTLARFMAAHWATSAVHIVPVFGERGALLEHWVFDLFYNYPLTIRRRMRLRGEARAELPVRKYYIWPIMAIACAIYVGAIAWARGHYGILPSFGDLWVVNLLLPVGVGVAIDLLAGGANMGTRVKNSMMASAIAGGLAMVIYVAMKYVTVLGGAASGEDGWIKELAETGIFWAPVLFALLSVITTLITEINLPEVKPAKKS